MIVKPFSAYRPAKNVVSKVVTKSYHLYEKDEISRILYENHDSFLNIIKPEFGLERKSKPNSKELFAKSREKFNDFIGRGIFERDNNKRFYVYEQQFNSRTHTGIIGCAAVDDYLTGNVKIHEQTLLDREILLKNYLEACDINAEPVCLTYPASKKIDDITRDIKKSPPLYDFIDDEGKQHRLWMVEKWHHLDGITKSFADIPSVYIADGHHRIASSVLLAKEKRAQNPKSWGDEPYNFFLSIFFPDNQLKIYGYNRVVKDLNGLSNDHLFTELSGKFDIRCTKKLPVNPQKQHHFGMYVAGKWYKMVLKPAFIAGDHPAASLGSALLSEHVLAPALHIRDLRSDKRIGFVSGAKDVKALEEMVDKGEWAVAFTVCPLEISQLYKVADSGEVMPPKSTWIEPKLLSGLVVYRLG